MIALGLDIGGANVKAAMIDVKVGELLTSTRYFPIWKRRKDELAKVIREMVDHLTSGKRLSGAGITMTAEVSDVYFSKREGVHHVLDCVKSALEAPHLSVLTTDAKLVSIADAKVNYLKVASANWAATGWLASHFLKKCVVIDVGSTTTSIIPVLNGKVAAEGETDFEKLKNGELVYTGALRTPVSTIVNSVNVDGRTFRVSSERFALSADVHLVLGNITRREYTTETADDRGKSMRESLARLARVVCADLSMLSKDWLTKMAKYVYGKQIEIIANGIKQVCYRFEGRGTIPTAVTAGVGGNFLAKEAAKLAGFKRVRSLDEFVQGSSLTAPAVGVAFMVLKTLGGANWKVIDRLKVKS
jgi:hypothetical protein